ncbi:MAG: LysM peptidoglycan-binding domain-containing protein [Acidobacteria bacterium]|nr:LysM peptidoglycan-binding domain-containing protein [Acidobacteriota bacterium]
MKTGIRLAVLLTVLPVLVAAQTVAPPPRPLHLVGDHWTPYDPPTELPEGARVHTIVKGDTLWDLAQHYLGDPYLWPQIWERNPYIRDSHWIYPGDPVVIDIAVQESPVEETPVQPSEVPTPAPAPKPEEMSFGEAEPLGSTSDVYCFAELVNDPTLYPFKIVSAEKMEIQRDFTSGDVVYINGGTEEGIAAGDRFFILLPLRKLKHPVSKAYMGDVYQQLGQLKVLCAQEHTSICEITFSCDPIPIGSVLRPFQPIPVPLAVKTPPRAICGKPSGKPTGYVIYQKDDTVATANEDLIMIDLGTADGAYPGAFATIFHDNPVAGMPPLLDAEVGLLRSGEHYSTGRILSAKAVTHVGYRVELK